MRTLFTTEENLKKILLNPKNNIWYDIVMKQNACFVSHDDQSGLRWTSDKLLLDFHKNGVKINSCDQLHNLENIPNILKKVSSPIFLLDIEPEKAREISEKYGIYCHAIEDESTPIVAKRGWDIDTKDPDKEKSWSNFYDGVYKNIRSIIIIDRYLFASQFNQDNDDPDNDLDDSEYNITEILDCVLPDNSRDEKVVVTIFFSVEQANGGIGDSHKYTFDELLTKVGNAVSVLRRPFAIDVEVISINSKSAYYNDTHDRFVFSNYSITEASKMLKAYRSGGVALAKQRIFFDYLYSKGVGEDTKSSLPVITQERMIEALKKYLSDRKNKKKIQYAYNGNKEDLETITSINPMLSL